MSFIDRHLGPRDTDLESMLSTVGYDSLGDLVDAVVPSLLSA